MNTHRLATAFLDRFQAQPAAIVRAPGRVNLIGEHTDYNDGFVLPMALDRAVWIALRPRPDRWVQLHSLDFDQTIVFSLDDLNSRDGWEAYVQGVAWALQEAGYRLRGWEGVMAGDVPIGAGLSSSAATELAVARAFTHVSDMAWHPTEMAQLAQKAENQWVGVHCGIMDQLIAAAGVAGHALFIDTRTLATDPIPLPKQARFVVLYSDAPRTLAGSAYNQRRAECEDAVRQLQSALPGITTLRDVSPEQLEAHRDLLPPVIYRRARHVVTENARVLASVRALRLGDVSRLGELMLASHASLRDDYEVSSRELDLLVELAMAAGAWGARLTGAGFGGCAITLCRAEDADAMAQGVIEEYNRRTGRAGYAFVTSAADGARVMGL
ncbi:MAG TPA: galactokinase [Anaerolineae bacterium]|nr:galactokinase [Anaerolineae bacterium]